MTAGKTPAKYPAARFSSIISVKEQRLQDILCINVCLVCVHTVLQQTRKLCPLSQVAVNTQLCARSVHDGFQPPCFLR